MWRLGTPQALGVSFRRRFMLLAATLVVAVFANITLSQPAQAADAIWDGTTLTYEGQTMTPATTPPDVSGKPHEFEFIDTSATPNKATVIYFDDVNDPQSAATTSATLVTYDVASGIYSNPSPPEIINVTRNLLGEQGNNHDAAGTTCNGVAGIGWIICPLSNYLADGVDYIYGIVEDFLTVSPVTDDTTGVYQLWDVVRTLANVCFLIVFIVIIYSHLTSIGFSNYSLKSMLPRLIIAAVLVNVSFWIAALAVDMSNLLGHSIQSILVNIRENSTTLAPDVSWVEATGYILSGGTIAVASLAVTTMGSGFSLGFLLFAALISVGFAILVAFIILAARQAIITVLIIIAPLAFVAYILPNTQSLFSKWGKSFVTLLVFFPIFALVFGGSQLAGAAIISNAGGRMHIILIGMATQVAPLIITPLLIRFSSGILGQIANMTNSKTRGPLDRLRNWATDNAEMHAAEKGAKWAQQADQGRLRRWHNPVAVLGARLDGSKRRREKRKSLAEDVRSNRAEETWNRRLESGTSRKDRRHRQMYADSHAYHAAADISKKALDGRANDHFNHAVNHGQGIGSQTGLDYARLRAVRTSGTLAQGRGDLADKDMSAADDLSLKQQIDSAPHLRQMAVRAGVNTKEAGAYQESIDAATDETWARRQENNRRLRQMRTDTHLVKGRAKIIDESMSAADQRRFETLVNTDDGYLQIRNRKTHTIADTKHADFHASQVQTDGERMYYRAFEDGVAGSRELRQRNVTIEQTKKESATIASTLQKRADAHWEQVSRTDDTIKSLRLKEVQATDSQQQTATEWNALVENVRLHGAASPFITNPSDRATARSIHSSAEAIVAAERTVEATKSIHQSRNQTKFIESDEGRRINMEAQAAKDALGVAQTDEEALTQEWRTEEGAKGLTGAEAEIAKELRDSFVKKRAQTQRGNAAASVADQEYAKQVLEGEHIPDGTETIAEVAGGIAGAAGVSQAKATAKQTVVEAANKAIAAERTLVSQVKEDVILSDKVNGARGLGSESILDEPGERIAALASSVAGRYHMQSHIKLWERMGQLSTEATNELEAAQESGDPDAIAAAEAKVSKVKDMQQQVMADKKKEPFGLSDVNKGDATVGVYSDNIIASHRDRLKTHLSVEKLAEMDPDDLRLTYELARAGKLDQDTMDNIVDIYDQWKEDPILNKRLAPKLTKFLDPIVMDNNGDRSGYDTIPETAYAEVSALDTRRSTT